MLEFRVFGWGPGTLQMLRYQYTTSMRADKGEFTMEYTGDQT